MQQIIGVTELQRRFKSFLDQVVRKRIPIILTRDSVPEAVIIPYEDYLQFQQMRENEILAGFDQVWDRLDELNQEYSDDEIADDIKAARQE